MTTLSGRDLYLRHTDENGKQTVVEHRVWDAERFLTAQQQACEKINSEQKDPAKRLSKVEVSSREAYRTFRNFS